MGRGSYKDYYSIISTGHKLHCQKVYWPKAQHKKLNRANSSILVDLLTVELMTAHAYKYPYAGYASEVL